MERTVLRRTESHFSGSRGHSLFRRAWLPAQPERVLLLVHGFAEHSGRYDHLGAWFAARGCAVHAYDQQGHGRSTGARGHARFSDLLDDLGSFLVVVGDEHPDLPVALLGHSMGGLVVAAFARERRPQVACAVTSGAMLALSDDVSRARIAAARLLRWVVPRFSLDAGVNPDGLSRDPEVGRAYLADPLVFRKITVLLGAELLEAIRRTVSGAADVTLPMLLLHGEDDPITPVESSRAFHRGLPAPQSQLRTYPKLRHEIFNEPEREAVFRDVFEWVTARTG